MRVKPVRNCQAQRCHGSIIVAIRDRKNRAADFDARQDCAGDRASIFKDKDHKEVIYGVSFKHVTANIRSASKLPIISGIRRPPGQTGKWHDNWHTSSKTRKEYKGPEQGSGGFTGSGRPAKNVLAATGTCDTPKLSLPAPYFGGVSVPFGSHNVTQEKAA